MNTDISIADIVVHLHPDTTAECKGRIKRLLFTMTQQSSPMNLSRS